MLTIADKLKTIRHPLISSMHMKKDFTPPHAQDVLVIEANFPEHHDDYDTFDSYLTQLLLDLEDLKNQAENCIGKFDRVDICTH